MSCGGAAIELRLDIHDAFGDYSLSPGEIDLRIPAHPSASMSRNEGWSV